ncbi:MAG: tetratricopeptide repeat protein [Candidatus Didemnitutus sp.]|nr:tetratricopeptide repeat protein [Candidatus Didemnitutus sp.]
MKRLALPFLLATAVHAAEPAALARATALYAAGRYAEATASFAEIARDEPDAPAALYYLGKLAVHRRDYPCAVELLERAAQASPTDAAIALWLGNAHAWSASVAEGLGARVSHGRKALAHYRRAVELDPTSVPARFSLMNFYRHVPALLGGGIDRARAQAAEIDRLDPVAGAHARALLAFHQQDFAAAHATLQPLLAQHPAHYAANFLLGRIAVASGQYREAGRAALERCLQLPPTENDESHAEARALLAQLERPTLAPAAVTATR